MTTEITIPNDSSNQNAQKTHQNKIASQSWNPTSKSDTNNNTSNVVTTPTETLNDPNVKFPLENGWSFWFFKNDKQKDWKDNVKFITTVEFVEDFWGVYNHIQLVSKISVGCDYMFFKKDIPPMWEDPQNLDGGRWVLNLDKKFHQSLDVYWLNTLLALIGDQFLDESPYVNGLWVNVRPRADKISLWTSNAKNADVQYKIGRKFKEILEIKDCSLIYEKHGDDSNKKADSSPLYKI